MGGDRRVRLGRNVTNVRKWVRFIVRRAHKERDRIKKTTIALRDTI